jgi:hypothetical protein
MMEENDVLIHSVESLLCKLVDALCLGYLP